MSEEETNEEPEAPVETEDAGDKKKEDTVVEQATKTADRMEAANKKTEELLVRQEDLAAQKILGGGSDAGQEQEKPKVLSDTEYAEALERGEVNPLKEDGLI